MHVQSQKLEGSRAQKLIDRERVLVRKVGELPAAVAEALDFLEHDFKGERVWVKPNLLGAFTPEMGVTTNPELVRQVVRQLKARGAREVWVADNPGAGLGLGLETYVAKTGVVEASEGCFWVGRGAPLELPLKSRVVASVSVSRLMNEVDIIVNLPVFKTHGLTLLTGAMKNMFGIVVGAQKSHLHALAKSAEEFAALMVDIYQAVPRPMLHIMDALRGMDGQMGPSGGRVLKLGMLLAARNGVAMDAVMAVMAGCEPGDIPMIRIAGERGLGPIKVEGTDIGNWKLEIGNCKVEAVGDFAPIPGFRMPSMAGARTAGGLSSIFYHLFLRRPIPLPKRCTRCKECHKTCPAQAISMKPTPVIDRKKCISCFCCAEVCPERAFRIPDFKEAIWRNIIRR